MNDIIVKPEWKRWADDSAEIKDLSGGLSDLAGIIGNIAAEKGFAPSDKVYQDQELMDYWIGTKIALIHTEVSEVLEELRKEVVDVEKVSEEIADAIIRLLHLAHVFEDVDISDAVAAKVIKNMSRPHKHGKRF